MTEFASILESFTPITHLAGDGTMRKGAALPRTKFRLLVTGALGCAAVAGVFSLAHITSSDPLAHMQGDHRLTEARVSAFEYAAFHVTRSGEPADDDSAQLAISKLKSRVAQERSAENLRRLADAFLATGNAREAWPLLEEAARMQPGSAVLRSDLAAADMTLGRIADAAEDAARSLAIDSRNPSAAFNYALALEKLANRPAAIEAWHHYLGLDSRGGWSEEAQRRLASLNAPRATYETERELLSGGTDRARIERVARKYPQRARARLHNLLLPEWVESGRADVLEAMRTIAQARKLDGDPYLFDMVEHAAGHRTEIADGVRTYADARVYEKAGDWDAAARRFAEAAELLRRAGSPLAFGAEVYAASSEMSGGHNDEGLRRAMVVEAQLAAGGDRYPAVAAEAAWVRGLIELRAGASNEGQAALDHALAEARRAGEVEHEAAITEIVASWLAVVGEIEDADRLRLEVLQRLDQISAEPLRMYTAYVEMAFTSLRALRPHVALAFADAAARLATQSGDPQQLAESAEHRALALHETGRHEEAIQTIAAAKARAMTIISAGARDRTLSEIDYTTGRIEMPRRPDRAIAAFTSALEIWRRYGWRNHVASGFLARGQAALAAGKRADAERDFRAGIDEVERQRAGLDEPVLRIAYFERSDSLFDALARLLLDEGRTDDALTVVERERSRFLLDQISGGPSAATPFPASEIARNVEKGTAVLEFTLLDGGVGVWLVREGRIVHAWTPVTRSAVEAEAERHLQAVAVGDDGDIRRSGRLLFDQLIGPIAQQLPENEDLVIVPDGMLQSFPFATLVDPKGRFLIDRQPVVTVPSASVLLRLPRSRPRDTLLAVAEPAPEGFAVLPEAAREATDIAQRHPHGRAVVGASITPQEFLEAAARSGLVQFSGHATPDREKPFRSSLIFESRNGVAALTAESVARAKLDSHPFVVLAACSTGRGRLRRNEGVDSIAAAFLQAGARGVAATLWDVDDADSFRLLWVFHENLRAGARPSDALRNAQVALLHAADPHDRAPRLWGSFTLIGEP
jgi:CHAT domain-containing protein